MNRRNRRTMGRRVGRRTASHWRRRPRTRSSAVLFAPIFVILASVLVLVVCHNSIETRSVAARSETVARVEPRVDSPDIVESTISLREVPETREEPVRSSSDSTPADDLLAENLRRARAEIRKARAIYRDVIDGKRQTNRLPEAEEHLLSANEIVANLPQNEWEVREVRSTISQIKIDLFRSRGFASDE